MYGFAGGTFKINSLHLAHQAWVLVCPLAWVGKTN
jgi:hypothetical protein